MLADDRRVLSWLGIALVVAASVLGAGPAWAERRQQAPRGERPSPAELQAAVDSVAADPAITVRAKINALEELLETVPEAAKGRAEESWVFNAANILGRLYLSEGERSAAIAYLEMAEDGLPDDADLLNTLGYAYAHENMHLDRAVTLVRRALEIVGADTPETVVGYYRDSLGWALFRQSKLDSALVELEHANRLAPATPEIREHLVEVYDALGRRKEAEALLIEDLVAARGVDPERRTRLRRLHRTTPQGKPIPAELEVERQVVAREAEEIAAIEAGGGRVVRLESGDGFPLVATLYPAAKVPAPAVILVPMIAGSRSDYDRLGRELAGSGISALCLDLRGHGGSVNEELPNPETFAKDIARHLHGALLDLKAAMRYLREAPMSKGQSLAMVGASFGGFLAALATAEEKTVEAIVLLSPGTAEPYTAAIAHRSVRPTLFVAGAGDRAAIEGARVMLEHLDPSRSQLVVVSEEGNGTELLVESPELIPQIVRWIGGAFKGARGL